MKNLIVYFSASNNTKNIAEQIAKQIEWLPIRGGDMEKDQTSRVEIWLQNLGFEKK